MREIVVGGHCGLIQQSAGDGGHDLAAGLSVSSGMLGGGFWPIEIVTSPVLLALSKVLPLGPAMDALKGLAYYGWGFSEILGPVGYMAAFALVCVVLGVWLVDRRSA